jgi:hypothetical protein
MRPPAKKDIPRTRRMLDRIEPIIEVWTRRSWFWFRATIPTMSSTAFPKVARGRQEKEKGLGSVNGTRRKEEEKAESEARRIAHR